MIKSECSCLVCLAKKSGREFNEFANTWVRDNIHHANLIRNSTKIDRIPDKWRKYLVDKNGNKISEFEAGKHQDLSQRSEDWCERTKSRVLDDEARREADSERKNTGRPVDLVTRQSSPLACHDKNGTKVTVFREHEISVSWKPTTVTKPPRFDGAFSSWQMSPKTRRRVTLAGKWLVAKHPNSVFITLTYDRPVCDSDAKVHLDKFLKRLRRSEFNPQGVLWVAERTQRHYIHFHLICSNFVGAGWIQTAWRGSTGLKLYTNVRKAGKHTAPYMVKYAAKNDRAYIVGRRWGQSKYLQDGVKCNWRSEREPMNWDEFIAQRDPSQFGGREVWTRNGYLLDLEVTPAPRKWFDTE